MTNSIEENMFAELINLRNENQMLKEQLEQLSQTNTNSGIIHNNSYTTEMSKKAVQRRQQLLDMLEPSNYETEDEYNNMSIEDMAKGYEEMGNIILQENLELSQNN